MVSAFDPKRYPHGVVPRVAVGYGIAAYLLVALVVVVFVYGLGYTPAIGRFTTAPRVDLGLVVHNAHLVDAVALDHRIDPGLANVFLAGTIGWQFPPLTYLALPGAVLAAAGYLVPERTIGTDGALSTHFLAGASLAAGYAPAMTAGVGAVWTSQFVQHGVVLGPNPLTTLAIGTGLPVLAGGTGAVAHHWRQP